MASLNQTSRITIKYALILGGIALLCSAILAFVYQLTKNKIATVAAQQQQTLLLEVIPQHLFDNHLIENCHQLSLSQYPFLHQIYIAKKNGHPTAYAIQSTAPDGYSGNIDLLIGITPDGTILGVRVLSHKETPGLGDKIETRISDWINSFSQKQFTLANESQWAVKKDGGQFDQFTGATITPRAVVNNVKQTAKWLVQHHSSEVEFASFPNCN